MNFQTCLEKSKTQKSSNIPRSQMNEMLMCFVLIDFFAEHDRCQMYIIKLRWPLLLPIVGQLTTTTPNFSFHIIKIFARNKLFTLAAAKDTNGLFNIFPYCC